MRGAVSAIVGARSRSRRVPIAPVWSSFCREGRKVAPRHPAALVICAGPHYVSPRSILDVSRGLWGFVPSSHAGRCGSTSRRGVVARRGLPAQMRTRSLKTGTVKWFNPTKGYGFIQPDGGGADAFVHISAVERAGYDSLSEGQRVQYELVQGRNGKSSAENLKIVG
jgi:CspA family cold shock protein